MESRVLQNLKNIVCKVENIGIPTKFYISKDEFSFCGYHGSKVEKVFITASK